MVTEYQKYIYNSHLSSYKRHQNKPYSYRQNFESFEQDNSKDYSSLIKLSNILENNKNINIKYFFDAPYKVYNDKDYYPLSYYTNMSAVKAYTLYLKQLNNSKPDDPQQLEFIRESLIHIKDICVEKKLSLQGYLSHQEGAIFQWVDDLHRHMVSPYVILGFGFFGVQVYNMLFNMPEEERILLVNDIVTNFSVLNRNLEESKKGKYLIIEGLKRIHKIISSPLEMSENKSNIET